MKSPFKKALSLLISLVFILCMPATAVLAEGGESSTPPEASVSPAPSASPDISVSPGPSTSPDSGVSPDKGASPDTGVLPEPSLLQETSPPPDSGDAAPKLSPAESKLDTQLLRLAEPDLFPQQEGPISEVLFTDNAAVFNGATSDAQTAYVYIELRPGTDFSILEPYVTDITDTDREEDLAVAHVPVDQLLALAARDDVTCITPVRPPIFNTGSKESEGDAVLRAELARSTFLATGAGIKVGIISDGATQAAAAAASGDLPADIVTSGKILSAGSGNEGTAMMEIVHDLAPGADIYFHTAGSNTVAFNTAIDNLINAGCKIICDDVSWLFEPYYEDGTVATHVKEKLAVNHIVYVTSAGNAGKKHYQGQYVDDGTGKSTFGTDPYLYVDLAGYGGSAQVVLQWNDPYNAAVNNYDLTMQTWSGSVTTTGCREQPSFTHPYESVGLTNNGYSTVRCRIWIQKVSATELKNMEIYIYPSGGSAVVPTNIVPGDSIFGQAAVPGVLTCAAVDAATPTQAEDFSSRGPVTMVDGSQRAKPDITGTDGVQVTGAGGFHSPFFGTSASAPHVAAVAALYWSKYPSKTGEQVSQSLRGTATDLGTAGFDNVFGYGRADAYTAIASGAGPVTVTFNPQSGTVSPASKSVSFGTAYGTLPTPVRKGYDFGGWYTQPNGGGSLITASTTAMTLENHILYAKWTIHPYTVRFDPQSGMVSPTSKTVTYGAAYGTLPTPSKTGHSFNGWYTQANGGGTRITESTVFNITTDQTLYAKWTPYTYTITFDPQGGKVKPASKNVTYGAAYGTLPTPSKTSYAFDGWYTQPNGGGTRIIASAKVNLTANQTLYAKWQGAFLTNITLSPSTPLSPGFSKAKTSYTAYIGENQDKVTITPTKESAGASVSVTPGKTVSVANGKTVPVKIKVSYGKLSKTYTVKITRAKSRDNTLAALKPSTGAFTETFSPAKLSYTLNLGENTQKVTITATRNSPLASVSPTSKTVSLDTGKSTTVIFKVKPQSGSPTKSYSVRVQRAASTDAYLKSLKGVTLAPGFNKAVYTYTATIPANKNSVTLSPTVQNKYARVAYFIGGASCSNKITLASPGASVTVEVRVTAQNTSVTKSYFITITRSPA